MENTSNYGLKRWDSEDRILHTEFNDNWDKIDTALKGNADKAAALQTALASCGNCQIGISTYTGTGTRGEEYPTVITFPKIDRKSTRLNSSHLKLSRMPSSA